MRDTLGMNPKREVEIVGRRLELTDAIKSKVEEMADKLYEHDASIDRIRVELELERHSSTHADEFLAKGHVDDGRDHYIASAKGDDLYVVIGDLEQKLDRFLRKSSRRRVSARKRVKPVELNVDLPKAG